MKKLLAAALLSALGLVATTASAQSAAPDFPTAADQPTASAETGAKRGSRATAEELRRASMTPEEQQKEKQLELLAARTGNTSFSRSGPAQQYDKRSGGFMVQKYKTRTRAGKQRRGMTHFAGGTDPKGERLIDKKRKKFVLF